MHNATKKKPVKKSGRSKARYRDQELIGFIAGEIQAAKKAHGFTWPELTSISGASWSAIGKMIYDRRSMINLMALHRMLSALNLSISSILNEYLASKQS